MKINGTDEIIKLLLEYKTEKGGYNTLIDPENIEKIAQKVEKIIIHRDEFIQSGKDLNVKAEVQFSKSLNESPEAYLHRISREIINQGEYEKGSLNPNKLDSKEVAETVTRTGLLKDFILNRNENNYKTIRDSNNKWLFRVIVLFLLVLLIYFLLMW